MAHSSGSLLCKDNHSQRQFLPDSEPGRPSDHTCHRPQGRVQFGGRTTFRETFFASRCRCSSRFWRLLKN